MAKGTQRSAQTLLLDVRGIGYHTCPVVPASVDALQA